MSPALSDYNHVTNYSKADEALGDRRTKTIGNNTKLVRKNRDIGVELHGNEVVRFYGGGEVGLSSAGYRTSTTKDRLNRYTPRGVNVVQRDGVWYVKRNGSKTEFRDGMTIRV